MRWGAGGARCAQPAPRPSLGSEFQAAPLRLRPQPKAKRLLILSGGAFSSLPERLSQGPSLGRKRYSKEPLKPVLTFQHFLSACRPAKSGSKRALRKVDRSPAQTIPEPVKATLAPGILSELGPSSKPESARAPRRQVWPGPPLTLAPPAGGSLWWLAGSLQGFPHTWGPGTAAGESAGIRLLPERGAPLTRTHGWVGMSV